MKCFGVFLSFSFSICLTSEAAEWDLYNHPWNMDFEDTYTYELQKFPLRAELELKPWSESYWPTNKGSINIRWNHPSKDGFNYQPYTFDEIKRMSLDQLKQLSLSEKYDLLMGRYDYPLFHEAEWHAFPDADDWSGICDGWVVAAIQYREPQPTVMMNPDGILIPFGSSDIKGLMTWVAAKHFENNTGQVGTMCEKQIDGHIFDECTDINPGSLHVILGNQIGLRKESFVAEREKKFEVWNQPVYGYEFQLLGSAKPEAGVSGVRVHAILHYTDELDNSMWDPVVGTPNFAHDKLVMDYVLDIDERGNIIGGYWLPGSDHPDFVWKPKNKLKFVGYYNKLNELYKPVSTIPTNAKL